MKEAYETLQMDIKEISEEDVITVSEFDDDPEVFSVHENRYASSSWFM